MVALTWRSVTAPSNASANALLSNGANTVLRSIDALGNAGLDYEKRTQAAAQKEQLAAGAAALAENSGLNPNAMEALLQSGAQGKDLLGLIQAQSTLQNQAQARDGRSIANEQAQFNLDNAGAVLQDKFATSAANRGNAATQLGLSSAKLGLEERRIQNQDKQANVRASIDQQRVSNQQQQQSAANALGYYRTNVGAQTSANALDATVAQNGVTNSLNMAKYQQGVAQDAVGNNLNQTKLELDIAKAKAAAQGGQAGLSPAQALKQQQISSAATIVANMPPNLSPAKKQEMFGQTPDGKRILASLSTSERVGIFGAKDPSSKGVSATQRAQGINLLIKDQGQTGTDAANIRTGAKGLAKLNYAQADIEAMINSELGRRITNSIVNDDKVSLDSWVDLMKEQGFVPVPKANSAGKAGSRVIPNLPSAFK